MLTCNEINHIAMCQLCQQLPFLRKPLSRGARGYSKYFLKNALIWHKWHITCFVPNVPNVPNVPRFPNTLLDCPLCQMCRDSGKPVTRVMRASPYIM